MKWITRSHVHVDRVACPWLIARFVDSEAEFLFVAADSVLEAADREGAIPFDAKEVELGHQDGHCSFVSIIEKYGLKDPALLAMAEVINAADTGQIESSPYAAGVEAIARGYSLRFPDDLENIEHQFEVYDALYAFLRLKVAAEKR
ncbi:MAG: chromate resistance protein [candidate division WOR-3 bacterium]|nr:chromate resistance protein [candidate division WOR-3 bacterium]